MKFCGISLIVMGFAFLLCTDSNADLIGDTVQVQSAISFSGSFLWVTDASVVVGDGFELTNWGDPTGLFNIDIGGETILIQGTQGFACTGDEFQGLRFSDLDWLPMGGKLIGVTAESSLGTVDQGRVEFGSDFVNFDVRLGFSDTLGIFAGGDTILLTLDFAPVPEPSTIALWSLFGLVGGFVAWRKRKR